MAGGSGRIACSRCGANNFDTVTVCWKCSAPLVAVAAGALPGMSAPPVAQPILAAFPAVDRTPSYAPPATLSGVSGNSATSNRAAIWLGLLFPYFGLPIGLAFMMCDDRRRQEVGRLCVIWSLISGAIHLLLLFITMVGMREYILTAVNAARAAASKGGGMDGLEGL